MGNIIKEYYKRNKTIRDIENESKRRNQREYKKRKRLKVYNKYGGRCAYCGKKIKYEDFEIDHKIPKIIKGGNGEKNLMPACKSCNRLKFDLNIEEFKEKLYKMGKIKKDLYFQKI